MDRRAKIALFLAAAGLFFFMRKGGYNSLVAAISEGIPDGGIYKLTSEGSGSPLRIEHKGRLIASKGDYVYCSGFTFAVVMAAAQQLGLLTDKSVEQVRAFKREWYGAAGDRERQQGPALQKLGIGRSVPVSEARPGDFLQLWRTDGSGHSVVFRGWYRDAQGNIAGVRYRSAQPGTGVSGLTEKFAESGGRVVPKRIYFSRLG